jgi:glycosyltransferase involved in cell wall biosynthesis
MAPMSLDPVEDWFDAHEGALRDAVLVVHADPVLVHAVLRRAPDADRLALVSICRSPSDLQAQRTARHGERHAGALLALVGDLGWALRALPLRWRAVLVDGPIDNLSERLLDDLAESIASDGILSWRQPGEAAAAALDRLVAHGRAIEGPQSAAWRSLVLRQGLPRPGPTPRPSDWGKLGSALAAGPLDASKPGERDRIGEVLRSYRQAWLLRDAGAMGDGRWPFRPPRSRLVPPASLPDGRPWPRFSVVTLASSRPQDREKAILAVARQGYPGVEHILIDRHGSAETCEIFGRYRDQISSIVDAVAGDLVGAIDGAVAAAAGDIVIAVNDDDILSPGALFAIALATATSCADLVTGITERAEDVGEGGATPAANCLTVAADGPLSATDAATGGPGLSGSAIAFARGLWRASGSRIDASGEAGLYPLLWRRFAPLGAKLHVIGRPIVQRRGGIGGHGAEKTAAAGARPRILALDDLGPHGGAGIATARLVSAFRRAGFPVEAASFLDDLMTTIKTGGAMEIAEEVARRRPDLLLLGNIHGVGLVPGALREVFTHWPSLIVLHDLWWLTGRCAYAGGCARYIAGCDASCPTPTEYPPLPPEQIGDAWAEKRALLSTARPPALLAYSDWAHGIARAAFPSGQAPPIGQIRLGVPLDIFRPMDRDLCRDRLGLPRGRFVVLFSARFLVDARKGADQVWSIIDGLRLPDILFVAVGAGDLGHLDLPADRFRSLGLVETAEQMALVYAAADVVAMPSAEETFGQVAIEAMACGTPVVGHGLTGAADALVDGVTGLVTAAPSAAELEAALLDLYRRPALREALGFCARIMAENEWSLEASARLLVVALRRLGLVDADAFQEGLSFAEPSDQPGRTADGEAILPELAGLTNAEYRAALMQSVLARATLQRKLIALRQDYARLKPDPATDR